MHLAKQLNEIDRICVAQLDASLRPSERILHLTVSRESDAEKQESSATLARTLNASDRLFIHSLQKKWRPFIIKGENRAKDK